MKKKIIILLLLTIASYSLFADATVFGITYNQETSEPLSNVDILVWAESSTPDFWEVIHTTESDDDGAYLFEVPAGEYAVDFYVTTPIYGTTGFDVILEEGQVFEQDVYIQDTGVASWDTGYVFETDEETDEQNPLANVSVYVDDQLEPAAITNEDGFFGIEGILGEIYNWTFVKDGYETTEIEITAGYNEFTIEMIQLVSINANDFTFGTRLRNNYPNPFNPSTTIEFSIQNDSSIAISVYNIKGQKIKTLANNEFIKGTHSVIWNGDDTAGKSVSSGIYFYKLNVDGKTEVVKKCLLLK